MAEHLCDALWVKVAVTLTALVAAGHDLSAVAGPVQAAVRLPRPGPAGADGWGTEVRALESILGQLGELRARTSGGHPAGEPRAAHHQPV